MLLRLKSKTDAGFSLRAYLDTSSLQDQLKAAQKALSQGTTTVKVDTDFYKTGSQYAISASKLKTQIIDPIQQKIAGDRKYTIKIGTELAFDQSSLRQIDQIISRAKASLEATQRGTAQAREQLNRLTQTAPKGGLDPAALRRLQAAAGQAGIKTSATGATELRKELRTAFGKAGDDAIEGLVRGLVSSSSTVIDASDKTGKALIKALKKSLGIASPSKETRKLGQFSADGFGGGFVQGMVGWERQMAGAIRQAIGNAWKQGMTRDAAARGALADMGRDAGQIISTSLGKALRQGVASSVAPALKGGLLGGTGGLATGGLVGGLGAAGAAVKSAAMPAISSFAAGGVPQKLGMLGQGAASLAGGGANEAFNTFLHNSIDSVLQAALSTGGQGALLGAAGVGGVAAVTGLARGATGSLVSQAIESIKNRILGAAVQQAQGQMEIPGVTGGAVGAPMQNASNVLGLLQGAVKGTAQALQRFAQGLNPGELQQQVRSFLWNLAIADEQFEVIRKKTQQLGFRIETAWNQMSGKTPPQLLPPQPVPGTGLVRQQNLQLGEVVGRTGFDFRQQPYGTKGGRIGPADINQGRGYLEQTRGALESIGPGQWKVVEEANGIWQRIKTDSELAQERLALIAQNMTRAGNRAYRTWTDRQGIGTFNPFDQAFYRPTRPPQAPPSPRESNFIPTGPDSFGSDGRGGGGGGNRFGTPNPGGQLALRNVPVEFFTSFRDAERLLAEVEKRLAAVGKAFDTLKVKSQIQVDQNIRTLAVNLRAVQIAFAKGEVTAKDLRAAMYGAAREMAGLDAQSAEVQNLANAFENLGIQSRAAVDALQNQRNLDLSFIESAMGRGSSEATRAHNARDIQQLSRANDLVRTAQGASGFGGFRGREIGNDELNKAQQRSVLANAVREMQEYQNTLKLTETNAKTYQRVQAALTSEIQNAQRAYAVLNGSAKEGETITHLARNAWGTILDDFQNLVPQLLVFAVAYNLILQRVMATPGAVIQAAAAFDRLETSISTFLSATRGIGDASGVISELKGVALDLGIGFEKAASSYLRFAAATQGTPLQGQEVDITRTLATAGRNQGLSGEQIDRASTALTQILSKGRVQSEELRGQLAEQLPGALQISARAFGVTTKELYRMVEAGQIAGDEFVGKFIRQLKAEGASTNQLAGSFSNVTEQLGSSVQALTAAAGQPALAPLTLALQGVNAVIQALIPVAPVLTGLFVVLGAQALRSALGVKSLSVELINAMRAMFASKNPAEGYTAGLVRMAGAAKLAASALAMVGKAALIGLAFEAVAGTIKFLKGEVGSLGDEVKKVTKIANGGQGQGLNALQRFLGRNNIGQNLADEVTLFDARKIRSSTEDATNKIVGSQKKISSSIREVNRIDRQLYDERLRRDQAEANRDERGARASVERIKKLEEQRNNVQFDFSPEDAQIQLGALKAAEQATAKLIERQKAIGGNYAPEERELKRLEKAREEFEKIANLLGLLDKRLLKVNSLGSLQAQLKANEEVLATRDVNSQGFRDQQLAVAGARQAVTDQQLLPQERALKTQEMVLRRMSTELKVQENIQRIKLSLVESERKQMEAALDLERSRGRLREAVAQRRVSIASTLNAPEERLAAEAQLQRVRERNQARELQMQGQILGKDRERVNAETALQREQVRIQTQQLAIDKQMLAIERLKIEAAAKTKGISQDLLRQYYLQMGQIDKTIAATDTLIGQGGSLVQSVEARGAAELSVLDYKQQELNVQQELLRVNGLTEQQVRQIEAAQQDIANKQQASLNTLENAKASYEQLQGLIQDQLEGVRALVQAEQERARLAEEAATNEMAVVDRLLELQQGRNDGGFFERMAKASLLGASGEQDAYNLAQRRMELQRQIQAAQIRQKRLELDLKKQELKAEEALNALKLKGLRIENEKNKVEARGLLERERLKLVMLGDSALPIQKNLLGSINQLLRPEAKGGLGGYNPEVPGGGNSQNVAIYEAISKGELALRESMLLTDQERQQALMHQERTAGLERENQAQEEGLLIQERLFQLDAAQWFGQFLDKTTQLGRTLGVITDGLSEFRSTVSQAFGEAITNGASASEAIADAGKAFAGKIVTGLFDEMVLKPLEANLFNNLKNLLPNLFQTEQQSLTQSTDLNTVATQGLTQEIANLATTIAQLPNSLKAIDSTIPRPTTATPTYRAPENAGLAAPVAGTTITTAQRDYYIDQLESASGAGWRECYSAVAAMLASTYKNQQIGLNEYNRIRARYGDSTSSAAQLRALKELGLNASVTDNGSIEEVRRLIQSGTPVGLGVNHNNRSGHWIMAHGVTPSGDFIVDDPYGRLNQRRNTGWSAVNTANQKAGNDTVYSASFLQSIFEDRGKGTGRILRIAGRPAGGGTAAAPGFPAAPVLPPPAGASASPRLSSQAKALVAAASTLGVSPLDLATIIGFETGGTYNPSKWGGRDGKHMGLIQFGPNERKAYGAYEGQSFEEQVQGPVVRYLQDRFRGVGMQTQGADLLTLYRTVLGGNPKADLSKKDGFGTTPESGVARMAPHRAEALRRFFGGDLGNIPTGAAAFAGSLPPAVMTPLPGVGTGATLEQAGAMVLPQLDASTTSAWNQLGTDATQASQTLTQVTGATQGALGSVTGLYDSFWLASAAVDGVAAAAANTPSAFMQLNSTLSGVMGALGALGMGIAGAQQIGKGGVSGTLMGLAGIFGSIGSIAGMFGTGGAFAAKPAAGMSSSGYSANGLGISGPNWGIPQRARGGPVRARSPYIVGENGIELFFPNTSGTVVSNDRSRALLEARGALAGAAAQSSPADPFAANREALGTSAGVTKERHSERVMASALNATPGPLDIRYQSEVINQTEYVSADQFQRGLSEAAERGRALTLSALRNSVRTRRQVGI